MTKLSRREFLKTSTVAELDADVRDKVAGMGDEFGAFAPAR